MKRISLSIIITVIFAGSMFAGGPWPQQKGKGYFKISEWWVIFDQHYTSTGRIDPNVTNGIFNTTLYAEYGFTNRITGILNAPIFSRNYQNNLISGTTNDIIQKGEGYNGIGDFDLGVKYGLTQSGAKVPLSVSLILGLPTGKSVAGEAENLQTGDGEFNQMIQLDAGSGFQLGKTSAYVSALAGFNNRTNGFSDEVRFGLEAGIGLFSQKLWLTTRLIAVESLKNGKTNENASNVSIFANNSEYTSIGAEVSYYITKKWGISASAAGAFRGEIIAAAPSYSVGVFLDLSK